MLLAVFLVFQENMEKLALDGDGKKAVVHQTVECSNIGTINVYIQVIQEACQEEELYGQYTNGKGLGEFS